MKALVLAAGYGERLRPVTDTTPKPLVEIGGRPLVHYPLLLLQYSGIREVAINVHYLAGKIEAALGRGSELGLVITYSPEPVLLGTGGPLLSLQSYFSGEPFVVLNGDTIMDVDLRAMAAFHREKGAAVTMALREAGSPEAYSQVEIDSNGQIRRMRLLDRGRGMFQDFPDMLSAELAPGLRALMYCGAMICEPAVFGMMPPTAPFSLFADLLAPMVSRGLPLFGRLHHGFFRTVDDLATYEQLRAEFASSPPPLPYIRTRA